MADDNQDRRRKSREVSSCKNTLPSLRKDTLPPGRPAPDCDVPVAPQADPFAQPVPCPPVVTPNTVVPEPLQIGNALVTATCPAAPPKNGPLGNSVTVAASTYVANFFFTSIDGITNNQLTFISTLSGSARNELINPATTASRIVEITGLSLVQATELKVGVAALQAEVNATAQEAAYAQLVCFWQNTQQQAVCPAGALTNSQIASLPPAQQRFVRNPSVIAAGLFTSTVSQNEANLLALAAANDALLCLYGNNQITRTCVDIGFTEAITDVDNIPDTLDGQVRKGSFTVAANTVFSTSDVQSANIAATAIAESRLNCFYVNPPVTVTCAGEGRVAGSPGTTGPAIGNAITASPGQSITVPGGFFTSTISTADAQEIARAYALSLLECWICNTPQTASCLPQTYVDKNGVLQIRNFSPLSSPSSVTIPACFIRSEISQVDANTQALAAANSQLNCIYCNPEIAPTCVPPGFNNPPVPLSAYDRRTWSRDATAGAADDIYCCQGEGAAQNCYEIADGVGSIPIDSRVNGSDCRYGNDRQALSCGGDIYVNGVLTEIRGGGSAAIPADTVFVGEQAGGKAQANQLARDILEGTLQCFWYNFAQIGECPDNTFPQITFIQPARTVQSFSSQADADELAKTLAITRSKCVPPVVYLSREGTCQCECAPPKEMLSCPTVPEGTIASFDSQQEADRLADELACELKVCGEGTSMYLSAAGGCSCICPEKEKVLLCPEIPAGAVAAYTQAEADAIALDLACALKVCGPDGGDDGLPGNDGLQSACAGTCYGYYS